LRNALENKTLVLGVTVRGAAVINRIHQQIDCACNSWHKHITNYNASRDLSLSLNI